MRRPTALWAALWATVAGCQPPTAPTAADELASVRRELQELRAAMAKRDTDEREARIVAALEARVTAKLDELWRGREKHQGEVAVGPRQVDGPGARVAAVEGRFPELATKIAELAAELKDQAQAATVTRAEDERVRRVAFAELRAETVRVAEGFAELTSRQQALAASVAEGQAIARETAERISKELAERAAEAVRMLRAVAERLETMALPAERIRPPAPELPRSEPAPPKPAVDSRPQRRVTYAEAPPPASADEPAVKEEELARDDRIAQEMPVAQSRRAGDPAAEQPPVQDQIARDRPTRDQPTRDRPANESPATSRSSRSDDPRVHESPPHSEPPPATPDHNSAFASARSATAPTRPPPALPPAVDPASHPAAIPTPAWTDPLVVFPALVLAGAGLLVLLRRRGPGPLAATPPAAPPNPVPAARPAPAARAWSAALPPRCITLRIAPLARDEGPRLAVRVAGLLRSDERVLVRPEPRVEAPGAGVCSVRFYVHGALAREEEEQIVRAVEDAHVVG